MYTAYLNGDFGAHGGRQLMNDLCIQTASIVYIPNHYWERLGKTNNGKRKDSKHKHWNPGKEHKILQKCKKI